MFISFEDCLNQLVALWKIHLISHSCFVFWPFLFKRMESNSQQRSTKSFKYFNLRKQKIVRTLELIYFLILFSFVCLCRINWSLIQRLFHRESKLYLIMYIRRALSLEFILMLGRINFISYIGLGS